MERGRGQVSRSPRRDGPSQPQACPRRAPVPGLGVPPEMRRVSWMRSVATRPEQLTATAHRPAAQWPRGGSGAATRAVASLAPSCISMVTTAAASWAAAASTGTVAPWLRGMATLRSGGNKRKPPGKMSDAAVAAQPPHTRPLSGKGLSILKGQAVRQACLMM